MCNFLLPEIMLQKILLFLLPRKFGRLLQHLCLYFGWRGAGRRRCGDEQPRLHRPSWLLLRLQLDLRLWLGRPGLVLRMRWRRLVLRLRLLRRFRRRRRLGWLKGPWRRG